MSLDPLSSALRRAVRACARPLLCGFALPLALACATGAAWEQQAGEQAALDVEQGLGLVEGELADYVASVGEALVERARPAGGPFHFHVADMPEPNAFALPGGYVYVSRGMLAILNDEDELAGVLGHEIGHVAGRHHLKTRRRAVTLLPLRLATSLSSAAVGLVSPRLGRLVGALGGAPSGLVLASHGRGQEREADEIGQRLVATAGWDPAGLSRVMRTLSREQALYGEDPRRQSFFATHPTSPERQQVTTQRAATLTRAKRVGITRDRADFLGRLEGLLVGASGAEGVFVGTRFLHPDLGLGVTFPEGWTLENSPDAVGGGDPDGTALVVLSLADAQDDALEAAASDLAALRVRVEKPPAPIELGGAPAASAIFRDGDTRTLAYWVERSGLVFRILGVTRVASFEERRSELERVARSFRRLDDAERREVTVARLRLFEGAPGESVEQIVARAGSPWRPEQAAVANGLRASEPLAEARLVKLPVSEPYHRAAR